MADFPTVLVLHWWHKALVAETASGTLASVKLYRSVTVFFLAMHMDLKEAVLLKNVPDDSKNDWLY